MPELTWLQLAGVVFVAVFLATTDPATTSRIFRAKLAKWLGVSPREIVAFEAATDADPDTTPNADE